MSKFSAVAFSNIVVKNVPNHVKAKVLPKRRITIEEIEMFNSSPEHMRDGLLHLYLTVHSIDKIYNKAKAKGETSIDVAPPPEVSPDSEKWEEKEREKNGLVHIDWQRSLTYYRTKGTETYGCNRNHIQVDAICDIIRTQLNDSSVCLPRNEVLLSRESEKYYGALSSAWDKDRSKDGSGNSLDNAMVRDDIIYSTTFLKIAKCLFNGKSAGIVICSFGSGEE